MSADNYINELKNQRDLLADILTEKGVEASRSEKFNMLIPKVRDVSGSISITGTADIFLNNILSETVINMNLIITGTATVSNTEV